MESNLEVLFLHIEGAFKLFYAQREKRIIGELNLSQTEIIKHIYNSIKVISYLRI